MAVELLIFPAASALIMSQAACDGVLVLLSNIIHAHAKGIDQYRNGEDVQSEADLILKHLPMQLKSLTQIKDAMARPAITQLDGADMEFSRSNDDSERDDHLVSIRTCGEGDGGHRCPYFPCPDCHRTRRIFVSESDCKLGCVTSMNYEEDMIPHADVGYCFVRGIDVQSGLTCPDKGHTCPYFPCPICHRTR